MPEMVLPAKRAVATDYNLSKFLLKHLRPRISLVAFVENVQPTINNNNNK